MQNSDRRNSSRRSSEDRDTHTYNRKERTLPLPGWLLTVLIALIEGLIAVAAPIGIIYSHASLYTEAASPDANVALGAAYTLFLLGILSLICSGLIIFLLTTLMTLFYTKSKQGCLVGILAGACTYGWLFVAPYVFHLPGTITSSTKTSADSSWSAGLLLIGIGLLFYIATGVVGNKSGTAFGSWLSGIIKKSQVKE